MSCICSPSCWFPPPPAQNLSLEILMSCMISAVCGSLRPDWNHSPEPWRNLLASPGSEPTPPGLPRWAHHPLMTTLWLNGWNSALRLLCRSNFFFFNPPIIWCDVITFLLKKIRYTIWLVKKMTLPCGVRFSIFWLGEWNIMLWSHTRFWGVKRMSRRNKPEVKNSPLIYFWVNGGVSFSYLGCLCQCRIALPRHIFSGYELER